jgi:hypothetical protein
VFLKLKILMNCSVFTHGLSQKDKTECPHTLTSDPDRLGRDGIIHVNKLVLTNK